MPAHLFDRARLDWVTALFLVFALHPGMANAAPDPTPTPTLEVELDPAIPEADALAEWILEEGTKALAELPPSPTRRGTVRVSISGTLYDYDVSIITIREGSTHEEAVTWLCECTNEDLLARIRTDVQAAADSLDDPPNPAPVVEDRKPTLGLRDKLGFGLLGGGGLAVIVGFSLTAAGERGDSSRQAGIPIFCMGVGALAAGTVLLALEHLGERNRRSQSRMTFVPFVTHRAAHMGIAGRF